MGVIYKILKQQRQESINMDLSTATKCKVQAAIRQRQLQRLEEVQQEQEQRIQPEQQQEEDTFAEQQLQQLCRFLAENAARKKRQRLKQHYPCEHQQPLCEMQSQLALPPAASTHEMDLLLLEQLTTEANSPTIAATKATLSSGAPRDSILLKIRHQIFERKRQRQRQLAELMKQRLVVWRPW